MVGAAALKAACMRKAKHEENVQDERHSKQKNEIGSEGNTPKKTLRMFPKKTLY